jgi:exopolysaccharide biosynthesis WecB/TagA/CpsF family protein
LSLQVQLASDRVAFGPVASPPEERVDCFGISVARVDWDQVRAWFFAAVERRDASTLYFVNAHTLNLAWGDADYRAIVARGDLVLNDGLGLDIYGRLAGSRFGDNWNGTDLTPRLLAAADPKRPLRVFLYGSVPGRAEAAAKNIVRDHPGVEIVGTIDGFQRDGVIARINAASPDVLLVGMGNPVQERWIDAHRHELEVGVAAGIGALIDFLSGAIPRAPEWIRELQLEWAFRLGLEPRRLFRRYVIGNPLFIARTAGYLRLGLRPRG